MFRYDNIVRSILHALRWVISPFGDIIIENPNYKAKEGSDGLVIYCIHGLADRSNAFNIMFGRIVSDLPDSIKTVRLIEYDKRNLSTVDDANQIIRKIAQYKDKEIIFVAHSHGGLVASYVTTYLVKDFRVRGVITFGTPYNGSSAAIWPLTMFSPAVADMRPNSQFLTELRSKIDDEANKPLFRTFSFGRDNLVSKISAVLDDSTNVELQYDDHISGLTNPDAIDAMHELLHILCGSTSKLQYSIKQIILEINKALVNLMRRRHIEAVNDKFKVLENLRELLEVGQMAGVEALYPGVKTLGEFIQAFLYDMKNFSRPPITVLQVHKNGPFGLGKPITLRFVEGLIVKYNNVPFDKANAESKLEDAFKSLKI